MRNSSEVDDRKISFGCLSIRLRSLVLGIGDFPVKRMVDDQCPPRKANGVSTGSVILIVALVNNFTCFEVRTEARHNENDNDDVGLRECTAKDESIHVQLWWTCCVSHRVTRYYTPHGSW